MEKKKFEVFVTRTSFATHTIEVDATSEAEARELALADAGNHTYNEKDAQYDVEFVGEKIV